MAATPVGATTIRRLNDSFFILCKKVVLPVPALPVKNIFLFVSLAKDHAKSNSVFVFKIFNHKTIYPKFTKKINLNLPSLKKGKKKSRFERRNRAPKKRDDLLFHKCSTIGANGLNFSVRNGKR